MPRLGGGHQFESPGVVIQDRKAVPSLGSPKFEDGRLPGELVGVERGQSVQLTGQMFG